MRSSHKSSRAAAGAARSGAAAPAGAAAAAACSVINLKPSVFSVFALDAVVSIPTAYA